VVVSVLIEINYSKLNKMTRTQNLRFRIQAGVKLTGSDGQQKSVIYKCPLLADAFSMITPIDVHE